MYKHIVRDKRHSTFHQPFGGDPNAPHYIMESMGDLSEENASHRFKNMESTLSKSRQAGAQTLQHSGQKSTAGLGGRLHDEEDNYYQFSGQ